MTATFVLGGLLALVILIRQIRWIAVVVLLVAIGYVARSHLDYWQFDARQDHAIILRP